MDATRPLSSACRRIHRHGGRSHVHRILHGRSRAHHSLDRSRGPFLLRHRGSRPRSDAGGGGRRGESTGCRKDEGRKAVRLWLQIEDANRTQILKKACTYIHGVWEVHSTFRGWGSAHVRDEPKRQTNASASTLDKEQKDTYFLHCHILAHKISSI